MTDFHNFTNENGEVLILRRIPRSRVTDGGGMGVPFTWPEGVGAAVGCPDWDPEPLCGHGLHGWPWGYGLGEGCSYNAYEDIWLVIGCLPEDVVGHLDGGTKCKFRKGTIRYEGPLREAMLRISNGFWQCAEAMLREGSIKPVTATADLSPMITTSSNVCSLTYADEAHAMTAGACAHAVTAGKRANATTIGPGACAVTTKWVSPAATIGRCSHALTAGPYSNATIAGEAAAAVTLARESTASALEANSRAVAVGDDSDARAIGKDCLAVALGRDGRVRVGERGAFAIAYWSDTDGWRFLAGKVGEDGIEPNTWYCVKDAKLVPCNV